MKIGWFWLFFSQLLSVTLLLLSCNPDRVPDTPTNQFVPDIAHLENTTVVILQEDVDTNTYSNLCAGVFISQKEILTAKHCVGVITKNPIWKAVFNDDMPPEKTIGMEMPFKTFSRIDDKIDLDSDVDKPHFAIIRAMDPDSDLLLLESKDDFSHEIATIKSSNPNVGDEVQIIGHPGGQEYTYFKGLISGVKKITKDPDSKLLHITAPIYFGNSGGGAWTKDGQLIGICASFAPLVPEMSFFVSTETINHFLDSRGQTKQPAHQ